MPALRDRRVHTVDALTHFCAVFIDCFTRAEGSGKNNEQSDKPVTQGGLCTHPVQGANLP